MLNSSQTKVAAYCYGPFGITISSILAGVVCFVADCRGQTNLMLAAGSTNTIELVFLQGGEFLMGCPANRPAPWELFQFDSATPEHKVLLSPFWLGKYPVSARQFSMYLNESRNTPAPGNVAQFFKHMKRLTNGVYLATASRSEHPITGLSYKDAEAYCAWLSIVSGRKCRLPTEAEWEFAAKGGVSNRTYPWGEAEKQTDPLGSIGGQLELATPEGIFDLDGPVYQWCQDFYNEAYYAVSPYKDPLCLRRSGSRVIRGGPMFRVYVKGILDEQLRFAPTWKRFQSKENGEGNIGLRVVVQP